MWRVSDLCDACKEEKIPTAVIMAAERVVLEVGGYNHFSRSLSLSEKN